MAIHTLQPVAFREGWSPIEGEHYNHYFVGILSACGLWYLEEEAFTQALSAVTPDKAVTCPRCERLLAARYQPQWSLEIVTGPAVPHLAALRADLQTLLSTPPAAEPAPSVAPVVAGDTDVRTLVLDYVRHLSRSDRAALLAEFEEMPALALAADEIVPFFLQTEAGRNSLIRFLSHRRTHCIEADARQQFTAAIAMVRAWPTLLLTPPGSGAGGAGGIPPLPVAVPSQVS